MPTSPCPPPAWASVHVHIPQSPGFQLFTLHSFPLSLLCLAPCSNLFLPEGILAASNRPSLSLQGSFLDSSHSFPREDTQAMILHTHSAVSIFTSQVAPSIWQLFHVFQSFNKIQCSHSKPRNWETKDKI